MSQHPVPDDEWSSTDTQRLAKSVGLSSLEWRRGLIAQIEAMAETLEEVRDLARDTAALLEQKASRAELQLIIATVQVQSNDVRWLRYITLSVLVVVILAKLAEIKGFL